MNTAEMDKLLLLRAIKIVVERGERKTVDATIWRAYPWRQLLRDLDVTSARLGTAISPVAGDGAFGYERDEESGQKMLWITEAIARGLAA